MHLQLLIGSGSALGVLPCLLGDSAMIWGMAGALCGVQRL